ncbi:hypothetical protein Gotri_011571 [Gossypium trilobum]|uniref:Uncharacterized protein n=1 Tax=Gossypium trilobum TaxID=34281 RepID=A0A7J9EU70_9ROSI|nr:hypothetical protein [Gossypium trilobum]
MDLVSLPKVSWKQMLLGKGVSVQEEGPQSNEIDIVEDLEFLEGDVKKSMVNGLSAIEFSDRKRQTKTGGPRDNGIRLNITGSNTMGILNGKIDGLHENCNKPKMIVVDLNAIKQLGDLFNDRPQSSNLSNGPFVTTTYFNHTFEESEGMVMALDGNVLDLRKYSTIIFKENSNPNKGEE